MSGRRSKTGLEWLMDERSKGAEDGSAPAVPSVPAAPEPPAASAEEDIPGLEATHVSTSATVVAPMPASILGLETNRDEDKPRAAVNGDDLPKRGGDAVANALFVAEKAAEAAKKATDAAADEVADSLLAKPEAKKNGTDGESGTLGAAIAAAQAAVRAAVKATDDATDHVADEILENRARDSAGGKSVAGREADDDAGHGSDERDAVASDETSGAAEHRRAVGAGRSTRQHPRAVVEFEVRFKKGSEALVGKGRNVSVGGFFVEAQKQLPEGEVFQAQLIFNAASGRGPQAGAGAEPAGGRKLSVIAETMWATSGDAENPDRFPSGMGCKFLDVDDKDLPFLKALVEMSLAGKK